MIEDPNSTQWLQYATDLPPRVRQQVAAARNTQVRVTALREQMTEEGAKLKIQLRRLHNVEGVDPTRLAKMMELSRNRMLELLGEK